MYRNGFGINDLQWLMCHKTKPNKNYSFFIHLYLVLNSFCVSLLRLFLTRNEEETVTRVYKNTSSLIRKVVMVLYIEERYGRLLSLTPRRYIYIYIYIFRALFLSREQDKQAVLNPGSTCLPPSSWLTAIWLTALTDPEVENFVII